MKLITTEELKLIQLDMLQEIHSFCESNNIKYTLHAGTLLGAVRHKGYIPWDDDIDIAMTRPNYERFIKTFNGKVRNLEVFAPELNWDYYAPYANVCDMRTILHEGSNGHNGINIGVKIDVFPIDGVPNNFNEFEEQFDYIRKLNHILSIKRMLIYKIPFKNFKYIIKISLKKMKCFFKSYSSIQKKLHNIVTKHPYESANYAATWVFCPIKKRMDKHIFDHYISTPFEGHKFMSIKDYDLFLTALYGDYMQLPPMENRIPHHGFKAYWKN